MRQRIAIRGMHGLGDNLYQRAVLRELGKWHDVFLETPWPQLYTDIQVFPVRTITRFRTQAKNLAATQNEKFKWFEMPRGVAPLQWHYANQPGTMLGALERAVKLDMHEVDFSGPPIKRTRRTIEYMIVRPATVRREWTAASRNPDPRYLDLAARRAAAAGYEIVSVADLQQNEEWAVEPAPFAHTRYDHGELSLRALLALVAGSAGIISGVGWALPAALAYRVPMLCIFGGWGNDNNPARLLDPRLDTSRIVQAMPDQFCMCKDRDHQCNKTISQMEAYIDQYLRLAARRATSVAA